MFVVMNKFAIFLEPTPSIVFKLITNSHTILHFGFFFRIFIELTFNLVWFLFQFCLVWFKLYHSGLEKPTL